MTDPIVLALAGGWGLLATLPVAALHRRVETGARARALGRARAQVRPARWVRRFEQTVVGRVGGGLLRARRSRRTRAVVQRDLPIAVDLAGVAVGAGCTLWQAVSLAARYGPASIAVPLDRVVRATVLGASFDDALADAGVDEPALASLTDVLRIGARSGTAVAPALARVAREVRADIRRRAEAHARTVPVRLLFPLVFCALPAFALLTVAPVVLEGFRL